MLHSATLFQVNPSALCMVSASLVLAGGTCCGRDSSMAQRCRAPGMCAKRLRTALAEAQQRCMVFRRERTVQDVIQVQECLLIVKVVKVIPRGLPSRICTTLPAHGHSNYSMIASYVGMSGFCNEGPIQTKAMARQKLFYLLSLITDKAWCTSPCRCSTFLL